ncbi:uncharacterized protein M421DRAFT_984 [Didymella exigua CBS 183.55]|uniref:Uncharacterized protein n=1 Tax=Didymella exigua CBS 183.55 TaxID=1150837 RepID=A0A6A5S2P8_9PLEO|nr:uncharacterized protein M421DRAFT_984 [Didymella exigua CBS 183.55]KAF1933598.1 hypothetical protein M421DRAFT_984 [Didymella exigua CBS 183.55]
MDPTALKDSKTTACSSEKHLSETKHVPIVATTEQPEQHPSLNLAPPHPQAESVGPRRNHVTSLFTWWQETLTLLVGVSELIAIVGILAKFNQKEQPTWKYSINSNTIIAILSVVLGVCVLYGVEEALSQIKWLWYRRSRLLRHLEYFDAAERGPGGSLFLLFRLRRIDSVFIGCLVIIFSVAIGPFTQQAVKAVPCNVPSAAIKSSIQVVNTNGNVDYPRVSSVSFDLSLDFKAGFVIGAEPHTWRTADCKDAWWLRSLYNDGNATFNSIDANMEAVAVAMTNELRRTGSAWDRNPLYVQGGVSQATVCMRFD